MVHLFHEKFFTCMTVIACLIVSGIILICGLTSKYQSISEALNLETDGASRLQYDSMGNENQAENDGLSSYAVLEDEDIDD